MLNIVVPLAGPDFIGPNKQIKGLIEFRGEPLLKSVLESRFWNGKSAFYYFVFQDLPESRSFYQDFVFQWFPNSKAIYIGGITKGAAISAFAGISNMGYFNEPFIIDLADIYFEFDMHLLSDKQVSEIIKDSGAFTFDSSSDQYSYLKFDDNGNFMFAREKEVISRRASAGVYFFSSPAVYIKALAWQMQYGSQYLYKDLYYVCPILNGVSAFGEKVKELNVEGVYDLKA